MSDLLMLKYLYNSSDERVVAMWQEHPYDQYFAGEATFQGAHLVRLAIEYTLDTASAKKA
jgi:hypothetical protein